MQMKDYNKLLLHAALALMPACAIAQMPQKSLADFDTLSADSLNIYDEWADSPFNKGLLTGNIKVVDNPLVTADNSSAKVLEVQRSRYGSQLFGAKIRLQTPFALTDKTQYVHVMLKRPITGRVMLIGLGKRDERTGQSDQVQQFHSVITPQGDAADQWTDAVFPVTGDNGITISSLVVVPDCTSPHNLSEDFLAHIDDIVISSNPLPRNVRGEYLLNFPADTTFTRTDRRLSSIGLKGNRGSNTTIALPANLSQQVYKGLVSQQLYAKPGETLTASFGYSTDWMHGYVYLDKGKDGNFLPLLGENGVPTADSDLVTYSYANGRNSAGTALTNQNPGVNPPAFTLPDTLPTGLYRLRYKVDWDDTSPGGRVTTNNHIVANAGAIVDVVLNVHGSTSRVTIDNRNGDVLRTDGSQLADSDVPFGQPLEILMRPAPGFKHNGIVIRHGYNLSGSGSAVGTPQYRTDTIPAFLFRDNKYTIPAELIDGDVQIIAEFAEDNDSVAAEDYAVSFDKATTDVVKTDRNITALTVRSSGGKVLRIPLSDVPKAYSFLTDKTAYVQPGQSLTAQVVGTMNTGGLHGYLYIDYNQDGRFTEEFKSDGTPAVHSELASYTYYNGKNSEGVAVPQDTLKWAFPTFNVPTLLPQGVYRARFKFDENNISPSGRADLADAGGRIVDFLLNVYAGNQPLTLDTHNGNVYYESSAGAPPPTIIVGNAIRLRMEPVAQGYTLDTVYIKHGHNFDGPEFIKGNRQWRIDSVAMPTSSKLLTLATEQTDGRVHLTAHFKDSGSASYKLIFSDEFNAADGTQADSTKWMRSRRHVAAWNRFLSNREDVAYQEGGNLVLHAKPNDGSNGETGSMVTGGVQTSGKFSFRYGKVECRAFTNPHTGNFPAIWMMPDDFFQGQVGWPESGEIDIWEAINTDGKSYHTIHTHWANTLGNGGNPQKTFSTTIPYDRFHTYGLEWDENELRWFVDGKQVGRYPRLTTVAESQGQFPFRKNYYLILNQSVGNGTWAHQPDVTHTYTTLIDWIRVYQIDPLLSLPQTQVAAPYISTSHQSISLHVSQRQHVLIADIAGRTYLSDVIEGKRTISLPSGIYLVNRQKVLVP